MGMHKSVAAWGAALVLGGCAAPAIDTDQPEPALPQQWPQAAGAGAANADAALSQHWWRSFGSAELDSVVDRARIQSWSVAEAAARVRQAAARWNQAGAYLLPEVSGGMNATRSKSLSGSGGVDAAQNRFAVSLSASYEVDFWGKNRAGRDAAQAVWKASVFDRDTVQLTVTAGAAQAWLHSVALHERVDIARLNLQSAERLVQLVESRARAGAASALELAQQKGLVASQRRSLLTLQQQALDAQTALATLLGQAGGAEVVTTSLLGLQMPAVGAGVPAQLLVRRPDIARAEAQLAAAQANVQGARAAMLPRLTLTGSVGAGDERWQRIFDNPLYALAAGLTAPIFDAGRLAAGNELAMAQREELLATYRKTIIEAFADVQRALHAVSGVQAQAQAQAEELAQAHKALSLAETRYRSGAESLLTLLDAQRTLYAAQDVAVQLRLAHLQAHVSLYKALGGGWDMAAAVGAGNGLNTQ